ncbi:hypothetical protein [Pseudomonas sp. NFX5]|uniref:hypothetical protein n=1 Tax=Pseudomonas sp. NFX5 TaxID=2816961 RepID=UPI003B8D4D52
MREEYLEVVKVFEETILNLTREVYAIVRASVQISDSSILISENAMRKGGGCHEDVSNLVERIARRDAGDLTGAVGHLHDALKRNLQILILHAVDSLESGKRTLRDYKPVQDEAGIDYFITTMSGCVLELKRLQRYVESSFVSVNVEK